MAHENIQQFEDLLRSSQDTQAKLKAAADAYEGGKTDEKAFFEATIGKVAEEAGLPVSYEEAIDYAKKIVTLNDSELDAVAGGSGFCYLVGGSDEPEAEGCAPDFGAGACAFVGVTLSSY